MKNIVCIGGASIDHKLKSLAALTPGTSNPVTSLTSFGGVARNIAENLARWTQGIHLQCTVGDDAAGHQLLSFMKQLGVNIENSLMLKTYATSHYYAVLNKSGELSIALADMSIYDHIPLTALIQSWHHWPDNSIIFIDTNMPTFLIEYAKEQSKNKHHLLCIDPVSVPKAGKLPSSLDGVFLIKPNQQEASALTDMPIFSIADCITAGRLLMKRGVKNSVISLGEAGYVIINEAEEKHFPSIKIDQVQDVSGAGDAFFAGILFGLQQNCNLQEACHVGAEAAAPTIQSLKSVADTISAHHLIHHIKKIKGSTHANLF